MRCRRGQGQGLDLGWVGDLGWGGVGLGSWGWAFSFLCFGIVECAHGHAYAKQVRIMCVLSVPLLDQVLDFGFWNSGQGFRKSPKSLDFGSWNLYFGFWSWDFGFWSLDSGLWIFHFALWLSDFGILVFGVCA
jgi:hypothetical protein